MELGTIHTVASETNLLDIEIRHSIESDVEGIWRLYSQPSCYRETLQQPFPSLQLWQKRLIELPDNVYSLVAIRAGEVVGQIGMEVFTNPRRKHVANIGMAVHEDFRAIGIASALLSAMVSHAQNWLAVRRIELEVYTDNHLAISLYKKHGFVIEGEMREYAFRDGEYIDAFLMANVKD